jgi:nucleoside-diphosphate-sugar epimerase
MNWSGKKVLVTGGTGFIGSFLVEALLERGAEVRVPIRSENYRSLSARRSEVEWVKGDLRDPAYVMTLLEGVDDVFHLASCRRSAEYHRKKASDVLIENVRMSAAFIEAMKELEIKPPVTFFSTGNVPLRFDPLQLSQGEEVDGYVLGKALCEVMWFTASRQRGFPLLIVRPIGVYGPRDTFATDGNIVPALMTETRDADSELVVWGSGEQERAFLYVEDLVAATLALVDAGAQDVQYVSSPHVVSIAELSGMIRDLVRPGLPIRFDASKDVKERVEAAAPLHASLQGFSWMPLDEGLRRTYESWK